MNEQTLTAEGARLLRAARDEILKHPNEFSMCEWGFGSYRCGTAMCIAGWVAAVGGLTAAYSGDVAQALGFGKRIVEPTGHPLSPLFFEHIADHGQEGAARAAERINAFLWAYGYPPDEIPEPVDAPVAVAPGVV